MRSVGIVGLGHMGINIARKVLAAGYPLTVYNRTMSKAKSLLDLGASWSASPRELAENVDVVITMVSTDEAIEAVVSGKDGLLAGLQTTKALLEMSTLSPEKVTDLNARVKKQGARMLHCPVLGGPVDIYNGTASIFVGGGRATFTSYQGLLEDISANVHYIGALTKATLMKFAMNIMLTHYFIGLSSSINFAKQAGLPPILVHEIITEIAQPVVEKLGEKVLTGGTGVTFSVDNFAKDQRLFLKAVEGLNMNLPTIEAVSKLAEKALKQGKGAEDFTTLNTMLLLRPMK